ncbi:MAG: DUF4347 domain-containing protein [Pseudomonadota bacterium]
MKPIDTQDNDALANMLATRALYAFDDGLADLDVLQDALRAKDASLRVSRDEDCILAVTAALRKLRYVDELVLVGYGRPGEIALGMFGFTAETFGIYADLLADWKRYLAPEAKIVLVGCAVGAGRDGMECRDRLAALTNREVVAPIFTVGDGSWNFGGDWSAPDGWMAYRDEL